MRDILNFLHWQWQKFEFWQKCFIFSSAFLGAAAVAPEPWRQWLFAVPMITVFVFMLKWFFWDPTRASWQQWKKERSQLFEQIKHSDQNH